MTILAVFVLSLLLVGQAVELQAGGSDALLVSVIASVVPPQPQGVYRSTLAYDVKIAYWTGIEPHYGAFFTGGWGTNQHYLGPGGDSATCSSGSGCISSWSWWGPSLSTLLVDKTWYFSDSDHRDESNYQADLYYDW